MERFSWNPGFKEYFAVKATPNPFILKILKTQGFGMDCSSLPELLLAQRAGFSGGIGIPYRPEEDAVDLRYVSGGIRQAYDEIVREARAAAKVIRLPRMLDELEGGIWYREARTRSQEWG